MRHIHSSALLPQPAVALCRTRIVMRAGMTKSAEVGTKGIAAPTDYELLARLECVEPMGDPQESLDMPGRGAGCGTS